MLFYMDHETQLEWIKLELGKKWSLFSYYKIIFIFVTKVFIIILNYYNYGIKYMWGSCLSLWLYNDKHEPHSNEKHEPHIYFISLLQ